MSKEFIKTAVIGHPIAHSKSPLIHNYWLKKYGISGEYKAVDIAPDDIRTGVQALIDEGYTGFNVTVPHKVSIMKLCSGLNVVAREIGAVNTISIRNGKLYGTNTDAFGFTQNIKQSVKGWSFKDGNAVVLGAGGAAKAIIYALLKEGVPEIFVANRTVEKAEELRSLDPKRVSVVDWENRSWAFIGTNLIVNTTSLGMTKNPALDVDLSYAPKTALVTDIVYAPLMTGLLKQAKKLGMPYVTGIGMLLHQARPGFELWNGVLPDVTDELERLITK